LCIWHVESAIISRHSLLADSAAESASSSLDTASSQTPQLSLLSSLDTASSQTPPLLSSACTDVTLCWVVFVCDSFMFSCLFLLTFLCLEWRDVIRLQWTDLEMLGGWNTVHLQQFAETWTALVCIDFQERKTVESGLQFQRPTSSSYLTAQTVKIW